MCAVTVYVNDRLHHHCGRSAKRNPASQALIAVYLLRERAVGIDAIVKAAVATGPREKAEHDVARLHAAGLWATMQQD